VGFVVSPLLNSDPRQPIRLACMDMAGTTVDDGDAVLRAFRRAMIDAGVPDGTDDMERAERVVIETMGQSKITVFRRLFGGSEQRAQTANQRFELAYAAIVESGGVRPMPHVLQLFDELRGAGIKVCLTTGFSPVTRQAIVDVLGWADRVDLALSAADVGRGRPAPDMVLSAVIRLGIDDVRQVAVVGDTVSDLWAGERAGASIVAGVLTGAHDRTLLSTAPHTHLLDCVWDLRAVIAESNVSPSVIQTTP
jgi:phosphoglycolate phosphatase